MRSEKESPHPDPRETPEFQQGRRAFLHNDAEDDCPYPLRKQSFSNERFYWFVGYLEEQVLSRIGKTLRKHGMTWP